MLGSTARFSCLVVTVVTAGCGFKAASDRPGAGGRAGSPAGAGGTAGGGGSPAGAGGAGGGGGTTPVIVTNPDAATGDGNTSVSLDANCGTKTQSAKMLPPDIMLVMDRSLSMTNDINDQQCAGGNGMHGNCGASSKWQIVVPVLNQVITDSNATVNWGMFYLGDEPAMCGVAAAPVVPVTAMNAAAVTTSLTGNLFNGQVGTPTRRVIQGAVSYLTGLTDPNPKYLLLATDGQPNCATATSLNTDDTTGTDQAVMAALAAGIPTFVVGIGNTNAAATLNQLAIDGGRPQMGGATSYYQVDDAAALISALGTIVGQAATCTFDIGSAPDGTTAVGLGVFGDGAKIAMDPANGWSFKDATMSTIILNGTICDRLMSGMIHDVTVAFVCMPG
jgi:hypothetical protein